MTYRFSPRLATVLLALVAAFALVVSEADARPGGGRSSFGSRGSRTFDAAPATSTAPRSAAPVERSMTQPSPASPSQGIQRPGSPNPAAQPARPGSRFGLGLLGGLLGAGLIGALLGHGFLGGLGGLASLFGLLLQAGLIAGAIFLVVRLIRGRSQPGLQPAGMPRGMMGDGDRPSGPSVGGTSLGGMGMGGTGMGSRSPQAPTRSDDVGIGPDDYAAFERLLAEIQNAYGQEDMNTLRSRITPEMASYFAEELAENARKGVINRVSGAKLLQGDLAEAWREDGADYATVALRYSLLDAVMERASGKILEGSMTQPGEVTEVWTFRRPQGGAWQLSAIQQV